MQSSVFGLLLAFLLLPASVQGRREDEVARHLAQLGDPSSELRGFSERWLGAELGPRDRDLIAAAAASGGADVRRRLATLVAQDSRLVVVAADLMADTNPAVQRVGEEALLGMAGRYFPGDPEGGSKGADLKHELKLVADLESPWVVAIDPTQSLERLVEHLIADRSLPFALVIEPGTSVRTDRPAGASGEVMLGSWEQVLVRFARIRGAELAGFGLPRERSGGLSRSALISLGSTGSAGNMRAVDLAVGWVRAAQNEAARPHRQGLRALAASRWPAGLLLVEDYASKGDPVALEALLLAAEDGRRAHLLLNFNTLGTLLGRMADELSTPSAEAAPAGLEAARRLLAAYGGSGCLDAAGQPLTVPLLQILNGAEARSATRSDLVLQWLALRLLEGMPCGAPEVQRRALELLLQPKLEPALRLQALRTAGAAGAKCEADQRVPRLEDLLLELRQEASSSSPAWLQAGVAVEIAAETDLARHLVSLGVLPDGEWSRPTNPIAVSTTGLFATAWNLAAGEEVSCATWLSAVLKGASDNPARLARGEELALLLASQSERGQSALVNRVLRTVRMRAPELAPDLDRILLLAGLPAWEDGTDLAAETAGDDLALLGALGGRIGAGDVGAQARSRLLELLAEALDAQRDVQRVAPLLRAHERVLEGLFRAPFGSRVVATSAGQDYAEKLRRLLRQKVRSSLSEVLRRAGWPLPPRLVPSEPGAGRFGPPRSLLGPS